MRSGGSESEISFFTDSDPSQDFIITIIILFVKAHIHMRVKQRK